MTKAVKYLEELNKEQSETKVTMTHLMGFGLSQGLYKIRRDIGRMAFGSFKHSKKIGMTVLVDVEGGSDLVPITIFDGHEGTLLDFAKKCNERVMRAKNKQDKTHTQSTASANFLPSFLIQPLLHWVSYLNVTLNLPIPGMAKKDTHGHYILTNVGTLGMTQAFAPLCPPMHTLGLCCAGKIRKVPLMIDGKVEIQSVINTTNTGDHRYADAAVVLPLANVYKSYLTNPKDFDLTAFKENVHYKEKEAKLKETAQ